jgi:urate oxidase
MKELIDMSASPARLGTNRYGKSRVRVMRVTKLEGVHHLEEWNVQLLLSGDFETAHTLGDNSKILPTDTMKNTVYSRAQESKADSIEGFAIELIDFILGRNEQVTAAEVVIDSVMWKRMSVDGKPFPTAFLKGSAEVRTATVSRDQGATFKIASGLRDLTVLKTADSGFVGYIKDDLTTLPETTDRLFSTALEATWPYTDAGIAAGIDFNKVHSHLRETLLAAFARHHSLSVQQTLYAMAEAALAHTTLIDEIYMLMPNKHNLLVDLSRFGQTNANHIFMPTDEPHGTIEATVRRA